MAQFIIFLYAGLGLLLAALSIPLVQRKIKRKGFYGFRVPKTLSSDEIWYDANAYAGKRLFIAGLVTAAAVILGAFLNTDILTFNITLLVIFLVAIGWALVSSLMYLRKL
jgi:uncharacterized membrane protein